MLKIQKSLADCSICPLLDSHSVMAESNSKDDLSQVRLMIISDSPSKEEIEKATPITDELKPYLDKLNVKYFVTHTVLCETDSIGETELELCSANLHHFIEIFSFVCIDHLYPALYSQIITYLFICFEQSHINR